MQTLLAYQLLLGWLSIEAVIEQQVIVPFDADTDLQDFIHEIRNNFTNYPALSANTTLFDAEPIGYVDQFDNIVLDLDIIVNGVVHSDYFTNILEIGHLDYKYYPLIGLQKNSTKLYIRYTNMSPDSVVIKLDSDLKLNTSHHLQIKLTQNRIVISIDRIIMVNDEFTEHQHFLKLPIYACTQSELCSNTTISNIHIYTMSIDEYDHIFEKDQFNDIQNSYSLSIDPPEINMDQFYVDEISNLSKTIIGYIDINDVMIFEFDIIIHSKAETQWAAAFNIAARESQRFGLLEVVKGCSQLRMALTSFIDHNDGIYIPNGDELELECKHHIYFKYTQSAVIVKLNDTVVYQGPFDKHPTPKHLPIVTCPVQWHECADVTIFNLNITTKGYQDDDDIQIDEIHPFINVGLSPLRDEGISKSAPIIPLWSLISILSVIIIAVCILYYALIWIYKDTVPDYQYSDNGDDDEDYDLTITEDYSHLSSNQQPMDEESETYDQFEIMIMDKTEIR